MRLLPARPARVPGAAGGGRRGAARVVGQAELPGRQRRVGGGKGQRRGGQAAGGRPERQGRVGGGGGGGGQVRRGAGSRRGELQQAIINQSINQ